MKKHYHVCMTVAGSDPSGGAGIQADIKTMTLLGCYAQAVPTVLTIQNTLGVKRSIAIDSELVFEQMMTVMEDCVPFSVKIGIVPNAAVAKSIARVLTIYRPPFVVLDPILISSSGHQLIDEAGIEILINELIPLTSLITPNLPEARFLAQLPQATPSELAKKLSEKNGTAILVKGGHRTDNPTDILYNGEHFSSFTTTFVETNNTHGTGCVLSSAIASYMARGYQLEESINLSKQFITNALHKGSYYDAGKGNGAMYLVCDAQ